MSLVLETVRPIIEEILSTMNKELVDLEYVKEGKNWYLRVFADNPEGGIDIEDCAKISEALSEAFDAINPDPFPDAYYLEVSSPGVERPLKTKEDFQQAIGSFVHLDYYAPIHGEKYHEGTLLTITDTDYELEVMIKTRKKQLLIPKDKVSKARLAVKF